MNGKISISLFTTSFPYGGASANLLRYFSFCVKNGGAIIEVVMSTGAYYGDKIDQQSIRNGEINGIKYKRLGFVHHPKNYFGKFIDNVLGVLLPIFYLIGKVFRRDLDTIIIYNPSLASILIFLGIKILFQKELVVIIPEFYEKPEGSAYSLKSIKWYSFYFAIMYFIKYADKFIVLSSFLQRFMESRLNRQKPFLIMPNLTDPNRFNALGKTEFKRGFITIGYVGTPTRKDGILDLIKSFSQLNKRFPKTHLLIIGDITNGQTVIPALKSYALEQGIELNAVTFAGLTSHASIPELLLSCQILALTRPNGIFAEAGFPTKLGEYFACKKPVVITRVGDMANYFEDKKQVVFAEPENIFSIVQAFEFVINEPDKARVIGLNGLKWMDQRLNYHNQSVRIMEFLKI